MTSPETFGGDDRTPQDSLADRIARLKPHERAALERRLAALAGAGRRQDRIPMRDPDQERVLSFAQESIWLLHCLDPEGPAGVLLGGVRITGDIEVDALRGAVSDVIERHEVLRTTITAGDGAPRTRMSRDAEAEVSVHDLREDPEPGLHELIVAATRRPFDLERGPLLRLLLARLDMREHALVLVMHHIAGDGRSLELLVRDIAQSYARRLGEGGGLPPLPLQYADYAAWQRSSAAGLEKGTEFWRGLLADVPASLDLPADLPRPARLSGSGSTRTLTLDAALAAALRELGRGSGASLFMTLLAGLAAVVSRFTGQTRVPIATPVTGRGRPELEELVGCFVNTLVLPADLAAAATFKDLLVQVRTTCLEGFEHQDVPLDHVIAALNPRRDLGHLPYQQVMLIVEEAADAPVPVGTGLTLSPLDVGDGGIAKRDLTLTATDTGHGIRLDLTFPAELFRPATAARMLALLERALRGAAADPDRPLSELTRLDAAEYEEIVVSWNRTAPLPAGRPLHTLFAEHARRTPDAVAAVDESGTLTYAQLEGDSNKLAHHLLELGAGPETPVGICLDRSRGMVVGVLGILKAGAMYVPLAPDQPAERLRRILDDTGAWLVVTAAAHLDRLPASVRAIPLDDPQWRARPDTPPPVAVRPDQAAYLLYTSGSTGTPKGVVVEHRHLHAYVHAVVRDLGLDTAGDYAMLQPLTVDSCLTMLFPPLLGGGRLHLISTDRAADARALAGYFSAEGIDYLKIAPSHLAMLLETGDGDGVLPLRTLVIGGEASHWEFAGPLRDRARCAVVNHYGPTETTVGVTVNPLTPGEPPAGVTVPIGRPLRGTTVYILDARLSPVPLGVTGELYVGGVNVTRGYWGRPAQTAAAFVADPFSGTPGGRLYRTGDRARFLPDGSIEYLGRADEQMKINGFRVEPGEIEAALLAHDDVREALVTVSGTRLVAYVATGRDAAGLRDHLRHLLPAHMIPSVFVPVEALPRTPHGKVDRSGLPPASGVEGERTAPRDIWERLVADTFESVLGSPAGVDDDFFLLGGSSLTAMAVVARLRREAGAEISMRDLFQNSTVGGLAAVVRRADGRPDLAPVPVSREGSLPLSFAQQRLWFLHRFDPGDSSYHMPFTVRLDGTLDVRHLQWAFQALVERHEVLRSIVVAEDGEARQLVRPASAVVLDVADLADLTEQERTARLAELIDKTSCDPFDLASEPPLRAVLTTLSAGEHLLIITVHHIAADGWSIRLIARDLADLYRQAREGGDGGLRPLPLQYADYAAWQRAMMTDDRLESQLGYWRDRLAGPLPVLDLPADKARPAVLSGEGDTHVLDLPHDLADRLRELARAHGATLFMVLQAALKATLSRLSGAGDLIAGTVVAGRGRPEFDEVVGCFVNTLSLRTDLSGDPTFAQLLRRVRTGTLDAFANQDVPFDRVVEAVRPERDLSRHPIFQVAISLDEEDLAADGAALDTRTAKFDLLVAFVANGARFAAVLEYSTDLFVAATVARWAGHLRQVLEQVAVDPDRRVSDLRLVPEEEEAALVARWNRTDVPYPREAAIHVLVEEHAAAAPDRVALVLPGGERDLTYGELDRRANRLARLLRARGARDESRVGVLLERSADLVVAELAVLKAGCVYVPFETDTPPARLAHMLEDTGAETVVTSSALRNLLPGDLPALAVDELGEELARMPGTRLGLPVRADRLAYVMYTSGSTGDPKGIAIAHHGVVRLVHGSDLASLTRDDVLLQVAPAAFDSVTFEVWGALINGAKLVIASPGKPSLSEIERLVREHGVTTLLLTAGLFHQLVDHRPGVLRALRRLLSGGDVMLAGHARRALRAAPDLDLTNCYGPTESTTLASRHPVTEESLARPSLPIGRPISNTTLHVLDRRLRPAPIGVAGELYIGGDGLARGYWRRPGLTATAFVPDPFSGTPGARLYRSGDLARRLPNGEIEFLGRGDGQVKIRGFRVELGEVETVLGRHPALASAVASVTRPDGRLVAHIVPHEPGSGERELEVAVLAWMAERVPAYMVPSAVVVLDRLPLTGNFKVDRAALPAPDWNARKSAHVSRLPRGTVERDLAAIFGEVLGLSSVGADDDFFTLGGHSLLATGVLARIHDRFGAELPVRALFESPTVAGLATRLDGTAVRERPLPPVRRADGDDEPVPVSFAQRRLWFLDQLDPDSTAYTMHGRWRLRGLLDGDLLERCLRVVVERHEALRTGFPTVDGLPVQRILPADSWAMERTDVEDEAAALRLCDEEAAAVFDLANGPLLRARLIRLTDVEHTLSVTVHHIVADGWSVGVLATELSKLYRAGGDPTLAELPELPVRYRDYARWQHTCLSDESLAPHLDYWRKRLSDAPRGIDLPRRMGQAGQTPRGGMADLRLGAAETGEIRRLFAEQGVTVFMGLLATMATVLSRWSGRPDVVIGVPIAGRGRVELEQLIGMFMNTLAMRVELPDDPTFAELLDRVRTLALDGYAHQDLPFERLIEELQPERDLTRTPLVQVALNVVNVAKGTLTLPGVKVEALREPEIGPKFDMTLYVTEGDDHFDLVLSYREDLYEPELMADFLGQLARLLAAAAADPHRRVRAYPLAGEASRSGPHATSREASAGDTGRPAPLHEKPARNAERFPEVPALIGATGSLTYGELDRAANRLGHRLIEQGVRPGDLVPLVATRSVGLVVAMLACHKAGAAFALIDSAHPPARRERLCAHVGGRVMLDIAADPDGWHAPDQPETAPSPARPADAAYVMFTSGSTGEPAPVLGGHGPVAHFLDWHISAFGLTQNDRFALLSGLAYDPLLRDVFTPLHLGATLAIPTADTMADPALLRDWMAGNGVTVAHVTPPLLRFLAEGAAPAALPELRWVFCGGDVLTPADVARLRVIAPSARCVSFYGATETPQAMTWAEVSPTEVHTPVPLGRPIPGVDLLVTGAGGQPSALGEIGELCIRTPHLAWGYSGRFGLTAERFVADPWGGGGRLYRTGDLARWRGDGVLEFLGRVDRQVKVRGHRVEPAEVESVLLSCPGVLGAAVRGWGGGLVAYVVAPSWRGVSVVRRFAGEVLPEFAVPSRFVVVEELPLTVNGKVDWGALPDPGAAEVSAEGFVAPVTPVQVALAGIWGEVLGCARVGIHDNFFTLGGHSLLGTQMIARARAETGADLGVRDLFEAPTIERLATVIVERRLAAESELLAAIENLSDEEVAALLRRPGSEHE
ncbi:non-ribosomal peptide synthetase [Microtetraspora niveoalba]|uniref:non-ribosomal peptide synthetase n=1 Tax=Microtetraspora niveoalba TaxID=46175 RepID=UPI00082F834F|nr:non-ribosomal peptide synthetase [Microtetraspora niveoalba]